jgi:hypothetical protein
MVKNIIETLADILFYMIWIPICVILFLSVIIWALLLQWTGYVVDLVQKIFSKKPKDLDYYK